MNSLKLASPNFAQEHAATDDLLAKGELTEEEAAAQHKQIRKESLEFVLACKGPKHGTKKKQKSGKAEMTIQREHFLANKRREFADKILAEQAGVEEFPALGDDQSELENILPPEMQHPERQDAPPAFSMPLTSPTYLAEASPSPEN